MIREPKPLTLRRYGLSLEEWRALLEAQGGACFVCLQVPASGRLCIDHEHRPKWKKRPAEERKLAVRGLLCWRCNTTFVGRGVTAERARRVVEYLERFAARAHTLPEARTSSGA